jgi:hypothetical protein
MRKGRAIFQTIPLQAPAFVKPNPVKPVHPNQTGFGGRGAVQIKDLRLLRRARP